MLCKIQRECYILLHVQTLTTCSHPTVDLYHTSHLSQHPIFPPTSSLHLSSRPSFTCKSPFVASYHSVSNTHPTIVSNLIGWFLLPTPCISLLSAINEPHIAQRLQATKRFGHLLYDSSHLFVSRNWPCLLSLIQNQLNYLHLQVILIAEQILSLQLIFILGLVVMVTVNPHIACNTPPNTHENFYWCNHLFW